MAQERYFKLALEGYVHGRRAGWRTKKKRLGGIKESLKSLNITIQEATKTARDQRATCRRIQKELPLCASPAWVRQ